ncbi:MAG: hypothetical protein ABSD50_15665 [Smithella sp.]
MHIHLRSFIESGSLCHLFATTVIFLAAYASMATFAFCDNSHESDSQVWKVGQNRWTVQEEYNYGKWIETNVAEDFFIRRDMRVDCAAGSH